MDGVPQFPAIPAPGRPSPVGAKLITSRLPCPAVDWAYCTKGWVSAGALLPAKFLAPSHQLPASCAIELALHRIVIWRWRHHVEKGRSALIRY